MSPLNPSIVFVGKLYSSSMLWIVMEMFKLFILDLILAGCFCLRIYLFLTVFQPFWYIFSKYSLMTLYISLEYGGTSLTLSLWFSFLFFKFSYRFFSFQRINYLIFPMYYAYSFYFINLFPISLVFSICKFQV